MGESVARPVASSEGPSEHRRDAPAGLLAERDPSDGRVPALPRQASAPTVESLRTRRAEILDAAARYGAHSVRLYGSVARGQATEGSDIDFLVEFEDGRSLFDLGGLVVDLEDLLGRPVDVTTPGELGARVKGRVLADAVDL